MITCLLYVLHVQINFCLILYVAIIVYPTAVVVAGKPASGKTTALSTVVSTLNSIQGSDSSSIKLVKIYPDTYEDLSDVYGCVAPTGGDWMDSIFTSIFRKAHKVSQSMIILCCSVFSVFFFFLWRR